MKNFYETYQQILNNNKLSREEKIILLQQAKDSYDKQITQERNLEIAKYVLGTALEIGSAAVPMTKVGKFGAQIGLNALKNNLGRKISQEIGSGVATGIASGAAFGAGQGMLENKNPLTTSMQDALIGGLLGGALNTGKANIIKNIKGQELKNYGDIDVLEKTLRKQFNVDSRKFYQDYIQDIKMNKNGEFDFTKRGIQEQLRWNPKQTQNYPELIKDIKQAKRLPDEPNMKPEQKPQVSHYEVYRGQNGDHYIEVLKDGSKRYYITKDTINGTPRTSSPGSKDGANSIINYNPQNFNTHIQKNIPNVDNRTTSPAYTRDSLEQLSTSTKSPNTIIHNNSSKFNPTNGQSEQIFTREQIKNMSTDEFLRNEKAIMKQMKEKGIPTNKELEQKRKQTNFSTAKSSAKGRWVTINGNHVFIED